MTAQDAVSKIKLLLGLNETTEKFAMTTLVDGTQVETEGEFVEGATLMVVTEEGSIQAPAGMHETTDGKLITVDEAGVIVKIEEVSAEPMEEEEIKEEVKEEVKEEMMEEVEIEVPAEVAPMVTEEVVTAIVEALAPVLDEVKTLTEEMKKMKEQYAKFSKEPAAPKVKRNDFAAEKLTAVDRLMKIRKNK